MGTEASTRDEAVVEAIADAVEVLYKGDYSLSSRQFAERLYDAVKGAGMVTRDHLTTVRRQQSRCLEEKDRLLFERDRLRDGVLSAARSLEALRDPQAVANELRALLDDEPRDTASPG